MLLGIKWRQFVPNDEVQRLTGQPKLTAIVQSRRLTLFGHIAPMDDDADAKRILSTLPPEDWRRPRGRPPRITWLSTGYGPEPVSVEDVIDVRRYAILICMPETTTTTHEVASA